jgi:hypothetical protein
MSDAMNRPGFEESILYSDDDYEPYGYVSPQVVAAAEAQQPVYSRYGPYEREIEAAVLRRLEAYPGC